MVAGMDHAVRMLDTDRSKFIRNAIREKIESICSDSGARQSDRGKAALRTASIAVAALLAGMAISAHAPGMDQNSDGTMPLMATSAE